MAGKSNSKKTKKVVKDEKKTEVKNEIKEEVKEEIKLDKKETKKEVKHNSIFNNIIYVITICSAIAYFIFVLINPTVSVLGIISSFLLTLFSVLFLVLCITTNRKSQKLILLSSVILLGFYLLNIFMDTKVEVYHTNKVENFVGRNLTDVVKWANNNKIKLVQDYEFSDIIPEYEVITQSVDSNTNIKDIDEITVSISEGPNPYKEVVIPSMVGWDTERVINFVKNNYLSNVSVEFTDSDRIKNTVVEQSISGNLKRNDEIKLTFSYGDEGVEDSVTIPDFTNYSEFEVELYMKQYKLNYSFEKGFSSKIKKGYAIKQSIDPGTTVQTEGDRIIVTFSKGPKIKVPDINKMSVEKLTEWAIQNKLKLEFINKYDDSVKSGKIISTSTTKGEVLEQGTVVKVYVSLGQLKMPKFKDVDSFYKWADENGIKYNVEHEFSDTVPAGEVIKYSHKAGKAINNGDSITVTISDGTKKTVPNLEGLTKKEAINKLEAAGLKYNFIYKSSNSVSKDKVISQSFKAGSEVSEGLTVTVTLSSGKSSSNTQNRNDSNNNSNSNNNNNNNNNNNSGNNNNNNTNPTPTPTCNSCTINGIKNIIRSTIESGGGYSDVEKALRSDIQSQCSGIKVNIYGVADAGKSGMFAEGFSGGATDSCQTISIGLAN